MERKVHWNVCNNLFAFDKLHKCIVSFMFSISEYRLSLVLLWFCQNPVYKYLFDMGKCISRWKIKYSVFAWFITASLSYQYTERCPTTNWVTQVSKLKKVEYPLKLQIRFEQLSYFLLMTKRFLEIFGAALMLSL